MGDPKKHRKKYTTPSHPWQKERLDSENEIRKEYGLKTKKEIYKMDSILRRIKSQMKRFTSAHTKQAEIEEKQLISKLKKLKLIAIDATMDTVLGLELKNLMDRRLQSIVYKKGFANSMKQARQFIIHEHIVVGDKKITSPGYLVSQVEETKVELSQNSPISKEDHPERMAASKDIKKEIEKSKIKKEKPLDEDLVIPEVVEVEEKEVVIADEEAEEIALAVEESESEEEAEVKEEVEKK